MDTITHRTGESHTVPPKDKEKGKTKPEKEEEKDGKAI